MAEKNFYTLTRFSFLFALMKANTMWWRKNIYTRHLHLRVCVLLPDRYVIVTRYFVLDDIFRRVQFLNIIARGWLPKNSK